MSTFRKLIGHSPEAFSKIQMCSKESHLDRSHLRRSRAQTNQAFHRQNTPVMTQRRTVTASSPLTILSLFAFVTSYQGKNYLQGSVCSLAHFIAEARPLRHTKPDKAGSLSHTEPSAQTTEIFLGLARAGSVENFAVCMWNSSFEIWPNIQLVFYPTVTSAKKRRSQAATKRDSESSPLRAATPLASLDTSRAEGEDEKDSILSDYPQMS